MSTGNGYTRAYIYAALGNPVERLASLRKAFAFEPDLVNEAPTGEEFVPYKETTEFRALIGQ